MGKGDFSFCGMRALTCHFFLSDQLLMDWESRLYMWSINEDENETENKAA